MTEATVSSEAVSGRTISTSDIIGAGLKKCTPTTRSGRSVTTAMSMTGRVEVLVARMPSALTTRSSSLNSSVLTARSSTTDSITRSQSVRSWRLAVALTRARTVWLSSSVSLPRSTCLASDFSSDATMASADSCLRDRRTTSWPVLAATSAMPDPMIPEPRMPTRLIVMGGQATDGYARVPNRAAAGGPT